MGNVDQGLYCWGNVADGQLGLGGIEEEQILTPRELVAFRGHHLTDLACGVQHTLFIVDGGTVYSCGNNDYGQLGHELTRRKPVQISALQTQVVHQVACGHYHSIALTERGHVYSWGDNSHGQLGWNLSDGNFIYTPKLVKHLMSAVVIQVACGYYHTLALTNDSQIYSWGCNERGQLGHSFESKHVEHPVCIMSLAALPIRQVAAGAHHSFCITVSRAVYGWGCNRHGQLGLGDTDSRENQGPRLCRSLRSQKAKFIACGENHTAALTDSGGVFTWGAGMYGQLGHSGSNGESNPRQIFELMGNDVSMLSCGRNHTVAYVKSSGKLYSFGLGGNGQLGIGLKANRMIPSLVKFDENSVLTTKGHVVSFISAGGDQSFLSVVSAKVGIAHDKRYAVEDKLVTVTDDRINQLTALSGAEKSYPEINRDIERLFTSAACLNGSFLIPGEGHFNCSSKQHGVDIESARTKFTWLKNVKNKIVKEKIESSVTHLLRLLPESAPPDVEALRLYLTLPCSSYFDPPFNQTIVCLFGVALVQLDRSYAKAIDSWWSQLGPDYITHMVETFKQTLVNILGSKGLKDDLPAVSKRQDIYVCLEVLGKLKRVNDRGHLVPYEIFYIIGLHEKIDIRTDYLVWLQLTARIAVFNPSDLALMPLPIRLQGGLTSYCAYAFIFDGQSKTLLLKADAQIQMGQAFGGAILSQLFTAHPSQPLLELVVSRENIVQDTVKQLSQVATLDYKKPLRIEFKDEEALDAGGVKKEFFLLLLRDLLDPKYGMFRFFEDSKLLWFYPKTFESPDNYHLVGVVCGLAIYNSIIVDMSLPLALFKKLLKNPVTLDDLKQLNPIVGRSMQALLDYDGNDVKDAFGLAFEVSYDHYGEVVTDELEPGGSNKHVTKENREDYVQKYIDYTFTSSVQDQFEAFNHGFKKVCGSWVLDLFLPEELQSMVVGNESYDWHQLEEYTEYKEGYSKDHPTIKLFWEVFHEFPLEDKKKFLLFLTGCDRVPILGMKTVKLTIQPMKVDSSYLPVAHTCFNILDLPPYKDRAVLRGKLLRAIENAQGFGLA